MKAAPELPPDYDRALLEEGMTGLFLSPIDRGVLGMLRRAFEAHHPARTPPDPEPRIPRVLHQIWLGPKPLPDRFRRFRERWIELHPEWDHRLWTDAEVASLDFESRELFESVDNVGMQSDILRAEVVHRFGGVYADVDYECVRSIDHFLHLYDFVGTLRPGLAARLVLPFVFPSPLLVCLSFFGATPGHPVLEDYLGRVRRLWRLRDERLVRLHAVEKVVGRRHRERLRRAKLTMKVTYLPFGSAVLRRMARADGDERMVVLPPSYFNPLDTWWGRSRFGSPLLWWGLWRHASRGGRGLPSHYVRVPPHAYAVHHSAASWI